jgi:hypothetical protein
MVYRARPKQCNTYMAQAAAEAGAIQAGAIQAAAAAPYRGPGPIFGVPPPPRPLYDAATSAEPGPMPPSGPVEVVMRTSGEHRACAHYDAATQRCRDAAKPQKPARVMPAKLLKIITDPPPPAPSDKAASAGKAN